MFLTYLEANRSITDIRELDLIFGSLTESSQKSDSGAAGEDLEFFKKFKKQKLGKGEGMY